MRQPLPHPPHPQHPKGYWLQTKKQGVSYILSLQIGTAGRSYIIQMGSLQTKVKTIPFGDSPEDRENRDLLFRQFDVNGNQYLSLAECDKGIRDVLNMPELFELKPVIMRSFQAAKLKFKSKSPHGDEYISRAEFRFFLVYMRQYYTLWERFDKVEVNGDRKVSEKEFVAGAPFLSKSFGIKINKPAEMFAGLLKKYNGTANITFTDFCDWAIGEHMKLHKDHDDHDDI